MSLMLTVVVLLSALWSQSMGSKQNNWPGLPRINHICLNLIFLFSPVASVLTERMLSIVFSQVFKLDVVVLVVLNWMLSTSNKSISGHICPHTLFYLPF